MTKLIACIFPIAVFSACTSPAVKTSNEKLSDTTVAGLLIESKESAPVENSVKWEYREKEDPLDNTKTTFADLSADSTLVFDFPYNESSFHLTVRKKNGSTDIIIQCSSCQFLDGTFDDKTYRVKFDDEPPFRVGTTGSSSGNSDVVFLESVQKLLKKMKTAKRMIIEPDFYGSGRRPLYFTVEGFQWK